MRNPGGYASTWGVGWGDLDTEADTFTCGHCQRIVTVKPKCDPADAGGLCYQCDALVCTRCADAGICVPFEEMLARMEARRSYASLGELQRQDPVPRR